MKTIHSFSALAFLVISLLTFLPLTQAQQERRSITVSVEGCSFEMLYVAGGTYMRGNDTYRDSHVSAFEMLMYGYGQGKTDPATNEYFLDEIPRHRVDLYGFYLGRYEVTQRLWKTVMGYNPSNFIGDDLPVEQVSYDEVQEFIRRLNQYTGMTFRLPTEAEWEYAARGGRESKGYTYPGGEDLMKIGWSMINSDHTTHPVGSLIPNELGLYDMSGNVWEWCNDWYDTLAYLWVYTQNYGRPEFVNTNQKLRYWFQYNQESVLGSWSVRQENFDPRGPDTGIFRVGRGGSWADEALFLRSAYRNFWIPSRKLSNLGFRLALSRVDDSSLAWMPNQYIIDSIVDGKAYGSVTTTALEHLQQGMLEGLFSVAPGCRIRFSKGNLQYNAVANQWRFADHQFDRIGEENLKNDKQYAGWVDLFAWGTSGYRNKQPYYFSANPKYYGNGKRNLDGTSYDWGVYNRIVNGGEREGMWRTLSVFEWNYLLTQRANAWLLRTQGTVGGVDGIILLPDDWLERGFDTFDLAKVYFFEPNQWAVMERAGAVFLPSAGTCHMARYVLGLESGGAGLPIEGVEISFGSLRPMTHEKVSEPTWNSDGDPLPIAEQEFQMKRSYREPQQDEHQLGYYWTTVQHDERSAFALTFAVGVHAHILPLERLTRCSVRLVQDEVQQQPKSKKGRR